MENFDKELLKEVMAKLNKKAFVSSPQTQEAISAAQQQGQIQLTQPASPDGGQPTIGFPEIAQMLQQGLEGLNQGVQQIAQMQQQVVMELQAMKMSGSKDGKKRSVADRLEQLEQMIVQLTGAPAPGSEQQAPEQAPPEQAPPQ
jgi:hypothetical protein